MGDHGSGTRKRREKSRTRDGDEMFPRLPDRWCVWRDEQHYSDERHPEESSEGGAASGLPLASDPSSPEGQDGGLIRACMLHYLVSFAPDVHGRRRGRPRQHGG